MPRPAPAPNGDALRDSTGGDAVRASNLKAALTEEETRKIAELLDANDRAIDREGLPDVEAAKELTWKFEYTELDPTFRDAVPFGVFRSTDFLSEAAEYGFSPFQWAQVQTAVRDGGPDALRWRTFVPKGPRKLQYEAPIVLGLESTLETLPAQLTICGHLDIDASSIRRLPAGLRIEGSMEARSCVSLTSLPDGLVVMGNCYLNDSVALTHLPHGMSVSANLHLIGCTGLEGLPDDLFVRGVLNVRLCSEAVVEAARKLKASGQVLGKIIGA